MWFGACMSSIGTWMQIVAQGWLIYRLSHSAFLLALDQFLGGIPIFLFSLIGGVVADRVERRKILLGSQYVQMTCATVLTVLVATARIHVWPAPTLTRGTQGVQLWNRSTSYPAHSLTGRCSVRKMKRPEAGHPLVVIV